MNKELEERFKKEFGKNSEHALYSALGTRAEYDNVLAFLDSELKAERLRIREKFHNPPENFVDIYGYYDNENEWHVDYDRYFDDLIEELNKGE